MVESARKCPIGREQSLICNTNDKYPLTKAWENANRLWGHAPVSVTVTDGQRSRKQPLSSVPLKLPWCLPGTLYKEGTDRWMFESRSRSGGGVIGGFISLSKMKTAYLAQVCIF